MKPKNIAIIDYKMNNLFSVKNAIQKLGFIGNITNNPKEILNSHGVILPGVGAFPEAMRQINKFGLFEVLREVIKKRILFMGVCLGFQLLFESSEENENVKGLSILKGKVKHLSKFGKIKTIPHVGWNLVKLHKKNNIVKFNNSEFFYFVHSYAVQPKNENEILTTTYINNIEFCSSIYSDRLLATQFHPEKSGIKGLKLIKDFYSQEV